MYHLHFRSLPSAEYRLTNHSVDSVIRLRGQKQTFNQVVLARFELMRLVALSTLELSVHIALAATKFTAVIIQGYWNPMLLSVRPQAAIDEVKLHLSRAGNLVVAILCTTVTGLLKPEWPVSLYQRNGLPKPRGRLIRLIEGLCDVKKATLASLHRHHAFLGVTAIVIALGGCYWSSLCTQKYNYSTPGALVAKIIAVASALAVIPLHPDRRARKKRERESAFLEQMQDMRERARYPESGPWSIRTIDDPKYYDILTFASQYTDPGKEVIITLNDDCRFLELRGYIQGVRVTWNTESSMEYHITVFGCDISTNNECKRIFKQKDGGDRWGADYRIIQNITTIAYATALKPIMFDGLPQRYPDVIGNLIAAYISDLWSPK